MAIPGRARFSSAPEASEQPRLCQMPLDTTADQQRMSLHSWAIIDSFVSPTQAKEQDRQRLVELAEDVKLARDNIEALHDLVALQDSAITQAATDVHKAAEQAPQAVEELRGVATEQVRYLPLAGAGTGATIGGTVGGLVGLGPGACVGAAVGATVGSMAGKFAKERTKYRINLMGCGSEASGGLDRRSQSASPRLAREPETWRDSSGRDWGDERYILGDMTRAVASKHRSWKEKSGRDWGNERYHFGDISRALVTTLARKGTS
mmetsp:Transcript_80978/g.223976  ORF Transcript_80978/g.223976 Transcript_80978/m.223976 type:complete len:264 (-) Transcript_80978:140-931(-)